MFFSNGKTITQWLNVYIQLKINTIYLHIISNYFINTREFCFFPIQIVLNVAETTMGVMKPTSPADKGSTDRQECDSLLCFVWFWLLWTCLCVP